MHAHQELEHILYTDQQVFAVVNINVELTFNCVVDQNTGFNANFVALGKPVGLVSNWDAIPSVRVHVPESFSNASDYSLCENVRLLVQMVVVCIGVVEVSDGSLYWEILVDLQQAAELLVVS